MQVLPPSQLSSAAIRWGAHRWLGLKWAWPAPGRAQPPAASIAAAVQMPAAWLKRLPDPGAEAKEGPASCSDRSQRPLCCSGRRGGIGDLSGEQLQPFASPDQPQRPPGLFCRSGPLRRAIKPICFGAPAAATVRLPGPSHLVVGCCRYVQDLGRTPRRGLVFCSWMPAFKGPCSCLPPAPGCD